MKRKSIYLVSAIVLLAHGLGAQSGGPGKTAGEAMKNVQVLKDVPLSDWDETMAFISGALGVGCGHCHAGTAFESDDLKPKQTARSMILMTREINAKSFEGRMGVTCYTCHQGGLHPKGVPVLWSKTPEELAALKRSTAGAQPTTAKTESLPDADQLFENYRKAVGGDGVKSLRIKGTATSDLRPPVEIEIEISRPDRLLLHATIPGQEIRQILDGDHGWLVAPDRMMEMTAANIVRAKRQIDTFLPVKFATAEGKRKTTGLEKIGDRTYAVVEARSAKRLERLYFDTGTGLLYKRYDEIQTPLGTIPNEVLLEDYREVNGVRMPFRLGSVSTNDRGTYNLSEIQLNVAVDPAKFRPPSQAGGK